MVNVFDGSSNLHAQEVGWTLLAAVVRQSDPVPGPWLFIDDVRVAEGDVGGNMVAVVRVHVEGLSGAASVNYNTADGTALAGDDYTPVSGSLSFTSSSPEQTITVPILGDLAYDPSETFSISLFGASGATVVNSSTVTIFDDEPAPLDVAIGGAATVNAGQPYVLDLSTAADVAGSIQRWTVNWGDSILETVSDNPSPSSVSHTYAAAGSYTITATAFDGVATYAAEHSGGGEFMETFVTRGPTGPDLDSYFGVQRLAFGPDGHLYVSYSYSNSNSSTQ